MLVSIVIPCYNSEHTIGKVVELAIEEFEKLKDYECEFVLVNDYSRDGTWNVIHALAEKHSNVKGINLAKNFGQHNAIMAAMNYTEGDLIIGMDDDMQNHPSQIPLFLDKIREGYDIVFGVFKQRKFSAFKNLTGAVSRFLLWHLLDRPKDIQMIYLLCRRLISKPQIYAVESKIEKQMFPDGDMKIRIFESFSLSEQYTPSYLVDVYKDSLFAEIKRRSDLDYHILMRADWKVADDDSLLLTLEDSLWARNRAGELREWIQMVFYDRCAISIPRLR